MVRKIPGRSIQKLLLTQGSIAMGFCPCIACPSRLKDRPNLTLSSPSAHIKLPVSATKTQRWVMSTQQVAHLLLKAHPKPRFPLSYLHLRSFNGPYCLFKSEEGEKLFAW